MIKQGRGGRIIGASSATGKQGRKFLMAYSATKFAVRGMTQSAGKWFYWEALHDCEENLTRSVRSLGAGEARNYG